MIHNILLYVIYDIYEIDIIYINYKYYHYYIPSHNRIISKFFGVITVESMYIRWEPSHEPILYRSDHKSETTLGWMPEHKAGWWMVQVRFYIASRSWSTKTQQQSLQMFNSLSLSCIQTPRGCSGKCQGDCPHISQVFPVLRFNNETQFSTKDTPCAKVNTDFRTPICIFKENIHCTVHLTPNFYLSNHL